jgi:hypothetical protein
VGKKTYIDEKGYLRFKDSGKLVHRWVAHKYIYPKSPKHGMPFGHYQVHHIDNNKLNNDVSNLQIVTERQHAEIHNIPRKSARRKGCFIATAAYGTPFANDINVLRNWRDRFLMKSFIGKDFVEWYYTNSPPIAEYISNKNILKLLIRILFKPFILILRLKYK